MLKSWKMIKIPNLKDYQLDMSYYKTKNERELVNLNYLTSAELRERYVTIDPFKLDRDINEKIDYFISKFDKCYYQ